MRLGNLQAKSSRVSNLPNRNFFFRVTSSVFQFSWNVNFYFTLVFFYFCFVCLFFWDGRDGLEVELKGFFCFLTSAIENSKAREDKGRKAIWFWVLRLSIWKSSKHDKDCENNLRNISENKPWWLSTKTTASSFITESSGLKKNGFAQQVVLRQYLDPLDQWQ